MQHQEGVARRRRFGGTSTDNMFESFRLLERLVHFPHMHSPCDDGESVKRKDATPTLLEEYYAWRRHQAERILAVLWGKTPDERTLSMKYAAMYTASTAARAVNKRCTAAARSPPARST